MPAKKPSKGRKPPARNRSVTTPPSSGAPTQLKGRPTPSRRSTAATRHRGPSTLVVGGIVAALVAGVVLISVLTSGGDTGSTDAAAWDLPALGDTTDVDDDGRITLSDYEGTPVVVNFFASWCTSCEAELPRFDDAATATAGEVEFVFVNSNETGNWRPMAERTGIDDRVLAKDINGNGGNGLYFSLGGTGGMPMTAFYDAAGTLVHVDLGELSSSMLSERLAVLYGLDVGV